MTSQKICDKNILGYNYDFSMVMNINDQVKIIVQALPQACISETFYVSFYHARVHRVGMVPLLKRYGQVRYDYHVFNNIMYAFFLAEIFFRMKSIFKLLSLASCAAFDRSSSRRGSANRG